MDALEIDLGEAGGVHRFKSYDALLAWIEEERKRWQWLGQAPDRFDLRNYIPSRLSWLRDQVLAARNKEHSLTNQGHLFRSVFVEGERVFHSESDVGRRIIDIFESEGATVALVAYAVAARRIGIQELRGADDLRAAILVAAPSLLPAEALAKRLSQERRNLRDRTERLLASLEMESAGRRAQDEADRLRARRIAVKWARRAFRSWGSTFAARVQTADAAESEYAAARQKTSEEFDALRVAYEEAMRLKAPATYWRDKANSHRANEDAARGHLRLFFSVTLVGLAIVFAVTGRFVLENPPEGNATPVYVIISAGLATLAGVAFWIGRLLTKLYLSEHHLRIDAEEREIMTTTYLALTKDKAAEEADRQIILGALFRGTPDGIVKDDGPGDFSLAMLLSRLGVPGKP